MDSFWDQLLTPWEGTLLRQSEGKQTHHDLEAALDCLMGIVISIVNVPVLGKVSQATIIFKGIFVPVHPVKMGVPDVLHDFSVCLGHSFIVKDDEDKLNSCGGHCKYCAGTARGDCFMECLQPIVNQRHCFLEQI